MEKSDWVLEKITELTSHVLFAKIIRISSERKLNNIDRNNNKNHASHQFALVGALHTFIVNECFLLALAILSTMNCCRSVRFRIFNNIYYVKVTCSYSTNSQRRISISRSFHLSFHIRIFSQLKFIEKTNELPLIIFFQLIWNLKRLSIH